jgi:hypothetical protein
LQAGAGGVACGVIGVGAAVAAGAGVVAAGGAGTGAVGIACASAAVCCCCADTFKRLARRTVSFWAASDCMAPMMGASTSGFICAATDSETVSSSVSKMRAASFGFIDE